MTHDQQAVLAELSRSASLRILDLMKRTGLPRTRVTAALDQLKRERVVQAFSMGSRYSLRSSICPPATPPAHASTLADDTGAGEGHRCGGGLSAVGHTGAEA